MSHPRTETDTVPAVPAPLTRRRSRARLMRSVPLAALAVIVFAGCADNAEQDTWKPKGPNAQRIQDLQVWVFLTAGIVGLIVFAAIGFVVFRFKDRGQSE